MILRGELEFNCTKCCIKEPELVTRKPNALELVATSKDPAEKATEMLLVESDSVEMETTID